MRSGGEPLKSRSQTKRPTTVIVVIIRITMAWLWNVLDGCGAEVGGVRVPELRRDSGAGGVS